MNKLFLLLTLLACQPVKEDLPTTNLEKPTIITNPVDTIESLLAIDPAKYPSEAHWDADYDKIILLTLKKYPVKNLPCDPLLTLAGIVKAESSFHKNSTYMEGAPLFYSSDGLLQLSIQDEDWAKCGLKSKQDLYNPIRNLYCGIKIMNYNDAHRSGSFYEVQGAYWATIRWNKYPKWAGKSQGGWNTVREYWKSKNCEVKNDI